MIVICPSCKTTYYLEKNFSAAPLLLFTCHFCEYTWEHSFCNQESQLSEKDSVLDKEKIESKLSKISLLIYFKKKQSLFSFFILTFLLLPFKNFEKPKDNIFKAENLHWTISNARGRSFLWISAEVINSGLFNSQSPSIQIQAWNKEEAKPIVWKYNSLQFDMLSHERLWIQHSYELPKNVEIKKVSIKFVENSFSKLLTAPFSNLFL